MTRNIDLYVQLIADAFFNVLIYCYYHTFVYATLNLYSFDFFHL